SHPPAWSLTFRSSLSPDSHTSPPRTFLLPVPAPALLPGHNSPAPRSSRPCFVPDIRPPAWSASSTSSQAHAASPSASGCLAQTFPDRSPLLPTQSPGPSPPQRSSNARFSFLRTPNPMDTFPADSPALPLLLVPRTPVSPPSNLYSAPQTRSPRQIPPNLQPSRHQNAARGTEYCAAPSDSALRTTTHTRSSVRPPPRLPSPPVFPVHKTQSSVSPAPNPPTLSYPRSPIPSAAARVIPGSSPHEMPRPPQSPANNPPGQA